MTSQVVQVILQNGTIIDTRDYHVVITEKHLYIYGMGLSGSALMFNLPAIHSTTTIRTYNDSGTTPFALG